MLLVCVHIHDFGHLPCLNQFALLDVSVASRNGEGENGIKIGMSNFTPVQSAETLPSPPPPAAAAAVNSKDEAPEVKPTVVPMPTGPKTR